MTPQRGGHPIFPGVLDPFLNRLGCPRRGQDGVQDETLRPQDDPRGRQDGPQVDKKTNVNRLQKRSRLRTVLRPSWGDLEPILAPSWGHFEWFCIGCLYYFVEIDVFEKKSFQDASWVDLGPIWVAKGVVLGGLLGLKLGQEGLKISSCEVLRP